MTVHLPRHTKRRSLSIKMKASCVKTAILSGPRPNLSVRRSKTSFTPLRLSRLSAIQVSFQFGLVFYLVLMYSHSATDNPLIDGETGKVHHGGNFQAMSVTNVMEKTR